MGLLSLYMHVFYKFMKTIPLNVGEDEGFVSTMFAVDRRCCYSRCIELTTRFFTAQYPSVQPFIMFTQHRCVAKSIGCFQRPLFVCVSVCACLFVNMITSEPVNIG